MEKSQGSPLSEQRLAQIVNQTIPSNLPNGHKNAIVGTVDQNGAQIVAGFHVGHDNNWEFDGAFQHTWTGDNVGSAKVIYSW
jgi:hypothetical protein